MDHDTDELPRESDMSLVGSSAIPALRMPQLLVTKPTGSDLRLGNINLSESPISDDSVVHHKSAGTFRLSSHVLAAFTSLDESTSEISRRPKRTRESIIAEAVMNPTTTYCPDPSQTLMELSEHCNRGIDPRRCSVNASLMNTNALFVTAGVSLIYSHHQQVPFKNFSVEVRAVADVEHFLEACHVLINIHEVDPNDIVQSLLEKMLTNKSEVVHSAMNSLFTHDKMHQLSHTIQGMLQLEDGTVDYDQNWICGMCAVPFITEATIGVATLAGAVNMGKNCPECRFLILILTPSKTKGTKNEYERSRTFGTMFASMDFRNKLLYVQTEDDFKQVFHDEVKQLTRKHSEERLREMEESLAEKERSRLKCGFMRGIIGDLRRRLPHYVSDYKDGFADTKSITKTFSCTFFLYFACILPCIAFGVLNRDNTDGVLNVEKVLYSQTFGGLVFAVLGGTPHIVLLPTAPLAIYSKLIYSMSRDFGLDFAAMYACVGLWNAFFLLLYAVFDLSLLMQFSTRSAEEIFAVFISIAFVKDALSHAVGHFEQYYNNPACQPGYNHSGEVMQTVLSMVRGDNSSGNGSVVVVGRDCYREKSLLYLILLVGTAWVGIFLFNFTRTPYLTPGRREVMADYSLPIAVIVMTFVGVCLFRDVKIGNSFDPDERKGALFRVVDFSSLSLGAVLGAMGLGFCLSLLFFMDQNISAAVVNAPQNRVVKVRETRVTAILSHAMIGFSILGMTVLAIIPAPVLYGLFLYVAVTALYDNQFFERIMLFFTEQAAYPPNHYIRRVPQKIVHKFTTLQLLQLGVLCVFGFGGIAYLKIFFPLLIFLLIPIRHKVIPRFIHRKYIRNIDHNH